MARLPAAQENAGIAAIVVPSTTYYLSLHTTDPGTTGAGEVTGGTYIRQPIIFGAASGGVVASTDAQSFTGMPAEAGGTPYMGLWTLASGGTYEGGGTTTGLSGAISAGSTVSIAIGAVTASVS